MLDVAAGLYFGLNPVASCVWRTIGTGASGADILEAVLAEFDVTPAEAEADIQQFVDELLARSLIETV